MLQSPPHHPFRGKDLQFSISYATLQRIEAGRRELTYPEWERIAEYCQKDINEIVHFDVEQEGSVSQAIQTEKEKRLEKIITVQNEQITSLLEEIRNLYGMVKNLVSGKSTKD